MTRASVSANACAASINPDRRFDGKSICVWSPVITAFEPGPKRVRNMNICSVVVF